ncbi:MAG TPA: glutamate--tRNA ligase [Anaerolineae bacterium]|nr:glutamate--tRNA ligase [Anaerolineae bacterium]
MNPVRVRFAPSPTGHLHLGGARTALYDYLIARRTGGQFILRIEDTDRKRFVPEAEQEIIEGLHWFGIDWDEGPDIGGPYGPYHQSDRKEIYQEYGRKLVKSGHAYFCFCSQERLSQMRKKQQAEKKPPHYDGTCRNLSINEAEKRIASGEPYVIRFKSPKERHTVVRDLLRGEIIVENHTLDDYILIKSDGWALYHLAAVVDDHLMKITHVIRGSEWLPTLPLHSLIHRAFGWEEPTWVHLSVFLKPSGKGKMSKREAAGLDKDGYSIFIKDLKKLGYLPEAVMNWIALMGWSYDDHTEYFKLENLIEKFSLERLNPSPAAINFTKLDHFNKIHIKALPPSEFAERVKPYFTSCGYSVNEEMLVKIAPIINERITTLNDALEMASFFFKDKIEYNAEAMVVRDLSVKASIEIGREVSKLLADQRDWTAAAIELPMRALLQKMDLSARQVFSFIREAISGQRVSPPLFESMEILGKDQVLNRLNNAINFLQDI